MNASDTVPERSEVGAGAAAAPVSRTHLLTQSTVDTGGIDIAAWIGIPYADCGRDPASGLDCWGLVRAFYGRHYAIALADLRDGYRSSRLRAEVAQTVRAETTAHWWPVQAPAFGDVVAINAVGRPFHVGIVIADRRFLHTLSPLVGSVIEHLDSPRWARRIEGYYRHVQRIARR